MTVLWGLLLIPSVAFKGLRESVAWVVFMSCYANFVGHFSSWQASRAENEQKGRK